MEFFSESRRRIERATLHLKAFGDQVERLFDPEAYEIVTEINSDWTGGTSRAVPKISLENTMAFELGEFFYQLWAALDSLIYQAAVLLEGSEPPPNVEHLYFPNCTKRSTFKDAPVSKSPFPQELTGWLDSIQPYMIQETPNTPQRELIETLILINKCAKHDRHRRFHIAAVIPASIEFKTLIDQPTVSVVNGKVFRINVLEDERPLFTFELIGADPLKPLNVKVYTTVSLEISIDQVPVPKGGRLDAELNRMLESAWYIVRYFENGFAAGHASLSGGS
jgi:hypothetical protein